MTAATSIRRRVVLSAGHISTIVAMALAWCGLWREISLTNLIVGVLLGIAILAAGFGSPGTNSIRPRPLLRLLWLVAVDLATSTVSVAWEVLTPTDYTKEAIIAVPVAHGSSRHFLLLTVAITLTPGTAVVDADPKNSVIYVHLLHFVKAEETIRHVQTLANLSCAALPQTDGVKGTR